MKAAIRIQIDGSSRHNPGPAGIGVAILDTDGKVLKEIGRPIGIRTNNQAEYEALICGLEAATMLGPRPVVVETDSLLLYSQLTGRCKVKNQLLRALWQKALKGMAALPNVTVRHIPRDCNRIADRLAQAASAGKSTTGAERKGRAT